MLPADELLTRMAGVLRNDIGPAVGDTFAKTQAFMAAVVLDKVAAGLRHEAAHAAADAADREALAADLAERLQPGDPAPVAAAATELTGPDGDAALSRLVAGLWAGRDALGPARFDELLGRVRVTLRARLDRRLEVSV